MNILLGNCVGSCDQLAGPPPDFILSMPPPPLPSFLISKPKSIDILLPANESQPCFAAFMCGQNQHNESGNELMELVRSDTKSMENVWFFVSSCIGIFVLGCFLALIVIRCKEWVSFKFDFKQGCSTRNVKSFLFTELTSWGFTYLHSACSPG